MNFPITYKGFTITEIRKGYYACPALNLIGYASLSRLKKWITIKSETAKQLRKK